MKSYQIPLPNSRDLFTWAIKLVGYLQMLENDVYNQAPKSVQLEHAKSNASAAKDGVLMWSRSAGTIVVSKGGAWYPVTLGAPLVLVSDDAQEMQ